MKTRIAALGQALIRALGIEYCRCRVFPRDLAEQLAINSRQRKGRLEGCSVVLVVELKTPLRSRPFSGWFGETLDKFGFKAKVKNFFVSTSSRLSAPDTTLQ